MLDHRAERQRRHVVQQADQQHGADQQRDEQRAVRGQRALGDGDALLGGQRAGDGQHRHDHAEAAEPHRQRQQHVVEGRVGRQAGEGAAVVVGGRAKRVQHFGEAVRARVERCRRGRPRSSPRRAVPQQHQQRRDEDGDRDHLHLVRLDLLAQVLGRAADHQPGDEHRHDGEHQHAVQARADAAEDHLAELHQHQRHRAAERRVASRASSSPRRSEAAVVMVANSAEASMPKRTSLPSMLPPACVALAALVDAERGEARVALLLEDRRRDRRRRRTAASSPPAPPSPGAGRRPCGRRRSTAPPGSAKIDSICRKLVTAASGSRTDAPSWR